MSLYRDLNELRAAWRDFIFELAYVLGIIWLIKRTSGFQLKPWVKKKLKKKL